MEADCACCGAGPRSDVDGPACLSGQRARLVVLAVRRQSQQLAFQLRSAHDGVIQNKEFALIVLNELMDVE